MCVRERMEVLEGERGRERGKETDKKRQREKWETNKETERERARMGLCVRLSDSYLHKLFSNVQRVAY